MYTGRHLIRRWKFLKLSRRSFCSVGTPTDMKWSVGAKKFPKEERYSMVDQIRRASRSVCANLSEAWRKRKYRAVFINKLTDCTQEAAETQTWLEFALKCKYITKEIFEKLDEQYEHIYAMLITMERKAETFCKS